MTPTHHSPTKSVFSILIPDGRVGFTLPVMNCLSQIPGIKIDILSNSRWTPARFSKHRRAFHYREQSNNDEWINQIIQIANQTEIDIVLPLDQPAIRALAEHKELFGAPTTLVPLPMPEAFDIAANKWLLGKFLQQNNLPAPKTIPYEDEEQLERDLPSLSFPVLTKPVLGKGGHGIKYWESELRLRNYLSTYIRPNEVIIQSFIRGDFTGCNVLCRDGKILAHTIQKAFLPPRYRFGPSEDIRFVDSDQVYEIVERLMTTLNWSGVANLDLIYDEQDASYKILEINPRYWGTLMGSLSAGVNFPYLACLAGLGIEFPKPEYTFHPYLGGIGIFKLFIPQNLRRQNPTIRIEHTAMKYFLSDPLPMLARWASKILKWVTSMWK